MDMKEISENKFSNENDTDKNNASFLYLTFYKKEERKVLIKIEEALNKCNRNLDVYIHDGGLVRKLDDELHYISHIIQKPGEKSRTAIILKDGEGCFKHIILHFIRNIIGNDLYSEIKKP